MALTGQKIKKSLFALVFTASLFLFSAPCRADSPEIAAVPVDQPVTVNGDTVEYQTENKQVLAHGNVVVDYKGTVLRCDKLTVNTETKDAVAEGKVRIDDPNGVMEGEKITYNFNTKKASVANASFFSAPYYGKAEKLVKDSDAHFTAEKSYVTTCDFDRPHFRIKSRKVDMYPKDKVQARSDTLFLGDVPVFYSPYFGQSLKTVSMIAQFSPGYSKRWGPYLLTTWKYKLTDKVNARIYTDYRDKLGFAEGFGTNFSGTKLGNGDFKLYYTNEQPEKTEEGQSSEYERYMARFRHKWEIDENTTMVNEYYKIYDDKRHDLGSDYNVLKDYFPREYEVDSQPQSYSLLTHAFSRSSISAVVQKRLNPWYDKAQIEKLPEVNYVMPSVQIGELPLYWDHTSQAGSYSVKHKAPAADSADYQVTRLDTLNKVYMPLKVSFIEFSPFAGTRETYYDKGIGGSSLDPRTVFYTGAEASTKFFRTYNANTNFMDLDINGLRHIITPKVSYNYNPEPTISADHLKQVDSNELIGLNNSVDFELSNKLQTKRNGSPVDLVNFIFDTSYIIHKYNYTNNYETNTLSEDIIDRELGNYKFKLELFPYSWMAIHSDAEYNHRDDYLASANYDLTFNFAGERSLAFGQRYAKSEGNELTMGSDWRLTPKWKFHIYERFQMKDYAADVRTGLVKQEYGFTRDLHCWLLDFNLTSEKQYGNTFWCIFRLKAFPEAGFDFSQSYGGSKTGSSSNPTL